MVSVLVLVLQSLAVAVPANADKWEKEDAAAGPLEVCNAIVQAAKADDFDGVIGRATAYSRNKFGKLEKLQIRAAHSYLVGARCVKLTSSDERSALIWVYIPDHQSRDVPFVRENGFWRLDQQRYETMHSKK